MDIFSSIKNDMQKIQNYDNLQQDNHIQNKSIEKIEEKNKISKEKDDKTLEEINKKSKEELKKELQKIIEELNKALNPLNTSLKFQFNNKVDTLTVEVVDKKTNETIRQFPPKEAIKLMEKMREIVGMLFDKKG